MFYYHPSYIRDYRDLGYYTWASSSTGLTHTAEYRAYVHWYTENLHNFSSYISFQKWKALMEEDLDLYVSNYLEEKECSD